MQWLLFVLFVVGPAMGADRIRSVGKLNAAVQAEAKNDMVAAVRAAKEAVELDPTHGKAHAFMGQLYYKQQKYKDAAAAYEAGRKVEKSRVLAADFSYRLGIVHISMGASLPLTERRALTLQAIAAYTDAIAGYPGHFNAHYRRARAHDWLDDPDAADADYRQCIRVNPKYSACFVDLATLYADFGFVTEAVAVIEAGLAANDNDADMRNGAGGMFLDIGRHAEAIVHFREALKIDPDMVEVLFGLGMAYAEARDRDNAVRNLTEFLTKAGPETPDGIKKAARDALARMQDAL